MAVSKNSQHRGGSELIERLERVGTVITNRINAVALHDDPIIYYVNDLSAIRDTLRYATARLRFLEMVTMGLTHMEKRDAADYAKFVDSKRKLEDMDIEDLRRVLR